MINLNRNIKMITCDNVIIIHYTKTENKKEDTSSWIHRIDKMWLPSIQICHPQQTVQKQHSLTLNFNQIIIII